MKSRIAVRRCALLLAAGGSALLSSCSTRAHRPPPAEAVPVPADWRQGPPTPGAPDPAAWPTWWTRFADPVLDELIADALRSSPDVHSALSRIAEYRARRGVTRADFLPALAANVTGNRRRITDRDTGISATDESYGASLDASWQVDLFGRHRQALAAASADLAQTEENYHGAQVSLAAEVAVAYVTLRSAEAQLAVVRHSLGTREETAQLTQWREQAGTGDGLATRLALAALESARASIPAFELTVARTRNQLALLAGHPPGTFDLLLAVPHDVPAAPPELAVGIPAEMLRRRPDVRAAERGLQAAYARTESVRRQRLPALTLGGSIGVEALSAGRLLDPAATVAALFAGLAAPVFDAGRIRQTITIQRELEVQALDRYRSAVLVALGEVENALVALQRNTERLALLTRAAAAAREASALSALRYRAGQIDLFISLDAQRTLLELEQQTVATAADRTAAFVQLYRALGGGWSPL